MVFLCLVPPLPLGAVPESSQSRGGRIGAVKWEISAEDRQHSFRMHSECVVRDQSSVSQLKMELGNETGLHPVLDFLVPQKLRKERTICGTSQSKSTGQKGPQNALGEDPKSGGTLSNGWGGWLHLLLRPSPSPLLPWEEKQQKSRWQEMETNLKPECQPSGERSRAHIYRNDPTGSCTHDDFIVTRKISTASVLY